MAVWFLTKHHLQNFKVSQTKLDWHIHLKNLKSRNSGILVENKITTLMTGVTILPQV